MTNTKDDKPFTETDISRKFMRIEPSYTMRSRYIIGEVHKVRRLTQKVREYIIVLKEEIDPDPGQFAMLWVPGVGEIPLSFADYTSKTVKFVISRVGAVTTYIHQNIGEGSKILLRGPLGKGFTIYPSRNCLLVGGGYGLAPLHYLAKKLSTKGCRLKILLGFKNSTDIFYVDEFRSISNTFISSEDGEEEFRGTVVELMKNILEEESFAIVYACGREEMLVKIARECAARNVKLEVSLERIIKCGLGVCGSCSIEPLGLRVCRDGPVFDGGILLRLEDLSRRSNEKICMNH
ncbi:MAG: dihydroorotate dehydrogenase electron transfer subunit [Nitrososphaerota archaeon]